MGKRAAVVIGINYDEPAEAIADRVMDEGWWMPLTFAEADAKAVTESLLSTGYSVVTLVGPSATREAIVSSILAAAEEAGPDGLLVVHFSGHGGLDEGVAYLITSDTVPGNLEATGVRMQDLVDRYLRKSETAVALLDCCASGEAVGVRGSELAELESRTFTDQVRQLADALPRGTVRIGQGYAVLAACAGSQEAYELPRLGHGAFTYCALQHWGSYEPEVTTGSLFSAVDKGLQELKAQHRNLHLPVPVQGGASQGSIVLRSALTSVESEENNVPLNAGPNTTNAIKSSGPSNDGDLEEYDDEHVVSGIVNHLMPMLDRARSQNQRDQVIMLAEQILLADKNNEQAKTVARDSRVARGKDYLVNASSPAAIIGDFTKAIELEPSNVDHYRNRAQGHIRKGEHDKAVADMTQCIGLRGVVPASDYFERGSYLYSAERFGESEKDLLRATRLDPTKSSYFKLLAEVYLKLDNTPRAKRNFELAGALGDVDATNRATQLAGET